MTILLIAFIAAVIVIALVMIFLSKSKHTDIPEKYSSSTADLTNASYQTQAGTNQQSDSYPSGGRNNGTAVLTPDMEKTATGDERPERDSKGTMQKSGTAVLRPEDDPFDAPPSLSANEQKSREGRGTEVLKDDDIGYDSASAAPGHEQPAESKAPPTELLRGAPAEEKSLGFFSKRGSKEAYLQMHRTKSKFQLDCDSFTIGREPGLVDLCIPDNLSISRHHATIKRKGSDYYIVDNDSLNYSFVNNLKVKPGTEMKLKNRDKIMLGDEAFVFIIK